MKGEHGKVVWKGKEKSFVNPFTFVSLRMMGIYKAVCIAWASCSNIVSHRSLSPFHFSILFVEYIAHIFPPFSHMVYIYGRSGRSTSHRGSRLTVPWALFRSICGRCLPFVIFNFFVCLPLFSFFMDNIFYCYRYCKDLLWVATHPATIGVLVREVIDTTGHSWWLFRAEHNKGQKLNIWIRVKAVLALRKKANAVNLSISWFSLARLGIHLSSNGSGTYGKFIRIHIWQRVLHTKETTIPYLSVFDFIAYTCVGAYDMLY